MSASTRAEAGQACLKWGSGSLRLSGPCVIGRRSDNDLQINNVQVSRRHALLMNHNDDWWLNDLGSRNGILVNGIRLTSARRLRDGDEIRIANHRIVFHNSSQNPPHHSTIVGKTTQVAVPATDETHLPAMACELIIATEEGAILEGEKPAHWFFGKSLERAPGGSHYILPPPVREWLERLAAEKGLGVAPLELCQGERRVVMSLARQKDERFFLLIREESAKTSIDRLQSLGLTEREAEVMHWVCEGKTAPEIAEQMAIASRTVNHHLEHIFKKLAVDNRQKAIKCVMERLAAV
ncbi:FHA domain-containing protein [Prosthecobacter sp.]|jgi:DNA-binding CsgD family transcriptional regulator/predicted component of type VI protein secretion system|uniref:FHA domain-containing protein n=1 Tax=Prosthecobacter sp. TaxID=1965333 RepID=UPI003782F994